MYFIFAISISTPTTVFWYSENENAYHRNGPIGNSLLLLHSRPSTSINRVWEARCPLPRRGPPVWRLNMTLEFMFSPETQHNRHSYTLRRVIVSASIVITVVSSEWGGSPGLLQHLKWMLYEICGKMICKQPTVSNNRAPNNCIAIVYYYGHNSLISLSPSLTFFALLSCTEISIIFSALFMLSFSFCLVFFFLYINVWHFLLLTLYSIALQCFFRFPSSRLRSLHSGLPGYEYPGITSPLPPAPCFT